TTFPGLMYLPRCRLGAVSYSVFRMLPHAGSRHRSSVTNFLQNRRTGVAIALVFLVTSGRIPAVFGNARLFRAGPGALREKAVKREVPQIRVLTWLLVTVLLT